MIRKTIMPDRDVRTIQDLIYYQYAKIIARRAFGAANGKEAKNQHYGFVKDTFRDLKSGGKSWSEITREDRQFVEAERQCVYCGAEKGSGFRVQRQRNSRAGKHGMTLNSFEF